MRINRRKLLVLIFISAFAALVNVSCSAKSSQEPPVNWFIVRFELEKHFVPEGADFFVEKEETSKCFENSDRISITNETSIPIFFEARDHWMESRDYYEPCPPENLCLKVVSSRAWEWDFTYHKEGNPPKFEWELIESYHGIDKLSLRTRYDGLSPTGSGYVLDIFENKNVEGYGGDRPDDVSVPESQFFELPFVYNGKEEGIGVTVTYEINECYPDESFIYEPTPYSEVVTWFIIIIFVGTVALIITLKSIISTIGKNATNQSKQKNTYDDK